MASIHPDSAFDALRSIALPTTDLQHIKGGEGESIIITDIIDL